jgi:chaperone required for assembly of F1-ATPase
MTPKEKAEELVNWFLDEGLHSFGRYQCTEIEDLEGSKFCAIKVVNEIINALKIADITSMDGNWYINEWEQVKQELNKL